MAISSNIKLPSVEGKFERYLNTNDQDLEDNLARQIALELAARIAVRNMELAALKKRIMQPATAPAATRREKVSIH